MTRPSQEHDWLLKHVTDNDWLGLRKVVAT
jgi:hypothetical protein